MCVDQEDVVTKEGSSRAVVHGLLERTGLQNRVHV